MRVNMHPTPAQQQLGITVLRGIIGVVLGPGAFALDNVVFGSGDQVRAAGYSTTRAA